MPLPKEVLETLPEDMRGNPTLEDCNSVEDVCKRLIDTKAMVGNSLHVPDEDAGEDAWKAFNDKLIKRVPNLMYKPNFDKEDQSKEFFQTLGVPEDEAGYKPPEDVNLSDDLDVTLRKMALEMNLTPQQFVAFANRFNVMTTETANAQKEARDADKAALKEEWGVTLDDRLAAAKKVAAEYFPGLDLETASKEQVIGLYKMSKALTGKKAPVASDPQQPSDKLPPDEARLKAAEIMASKEWFDASNPDRQKHLQKKVLDLLEMAGGTRDSQNIRARSL